MSPAAFELLLRVVDALIFALFALVVAGAILLRHWVVVRRVNVSRFPGGGAWHYPTDEMDR